MNDENLTLVLDKMVSVLDALAQETAGILRTNVSMLSREGVKIARDKADELTSAAAQLRTAFDKATGKSDQ